jgi:hypothetical protein
MRDQLLRLSSLFTQGRITSSEVSADYEFLKPWMPVDAAHVPGMIKELQNELPSGHVLKDFDCIPIGYRCDCDDTIWQVKGADFGFATVHLTFQKETNPRWPDTATFVTFEDFRREVMQPDKEEYEA